MTPEELFNATKDLPYCNTFNVGDFLLYLKLEEGRAHSFAYARRKRGAEFRGPCIFPGWADYQHPDVKVDTGSDEIDRIINITEVSHQKLLPPEVAMYLQSLVEKLRDSDE